MGGINHQKLVVYYCYTHISGPNQHFGIKIAQVPNLWHGFQPFPLVSQGIRLASSKPLDPTRAAGSPGVLQRIFAQQGEVILHHQHYEDEGVLSS